MESKEKIFVSSVIYVHNAEEHIEAFLTAIIGIMENNFEHSEIICVNDSSTDKSLEIVKKVSNIACSACISVINMSRFYGMEVAMNAGMDMAIGDFVFEFDNTNLDFDTSEVMRIYRHALEGFDIVSATSDKKERFSSGVFYYFFNKATDFAYQMNTESFRILSRRAINRINSTNKMVVYRKAAYAECGLKTDNLKYEVRHREYCLSDKKEKRYRSELAVDSLILFTGIGYKFSMTMTILMIIMSILMVFYSTFIYLTSHPVAGWTTTVLFLSIAFFGLFGILTVIIKYLQLLVKLSFKRKYYCFESIEKLTK